MDRRLDSLIAERDYYSAHQLLLSHAQRLERAGKAADGSRFLLAGIKKLAACSDTPTATLFDIVKKYMALSYEGSLTDGDDLEASLEVTRIVLEVQPSSIPGALTDFPIQVATWAISHGSASSIASLLLEASHKFNNAVIMDEACKLFLSHCPAEGEVWSLLGRDERLKVEDLLRYSFELLKLRCFASCLQLLSAYISQKGPQLQIVKSHQKISVYAEEGCREGAAVNLINMLIALLTREAPPRELLVQLQLRYSETLLEELKTPWNGLREAYWPSRTGPAYGHSNSASPLAAMLQSLMMGGNPR